jgi:hypothetical protein
MTSVLSQSATGGNVCLSQEYVLQGDVTSEVISLICTHLYLTVSRHMKNQLPGGCHTSDDEAKRQESMFPPRVNSSSLL